MQKHLSIKRHLETVPSEQLASMEPSLLARSSIAGLGHAIVYLAFRFLIPFQGSVPRLIDLGGCLIFAAMIGRFSLIYLQGRSFQDARWRARRTFIFRACAQLIALGWTLVSIVSLVKWGLTFPFILTQAIVLGSAAISVQAFALEIRGTQAFIVVILLPIVIALFLSRESGHITFAIADLMAMIYLLFLAKDSFLVVAELLESRGMLTSERDHLTAMLDAVPGYIFWTDGEGRYVGHNRKFLEARRGKCLIGSMIGDDGPLDPLTQQVKEFIAGPRTEALTETVMRFSDMSRNVLAAMKKYSGSQTIVVILDIEDQKRSQHALENARAQSQEAARLAALGVMAGGIAHEINNPLQVIRFLAGMLKKGTIQASEAADQIETTVARVAKIIAGLRSFGRGGENYPFEDVDVAGLVGEVVELARISRPQQPVPITVGAIPPGLVMECRRTEIGQVLINLINNAFDAVLEPSVSDRWIRIEVADRGEKVELRVIDSGSGVPEAIVSSIMLPFFSTKKVGAGTGLGLSISRSVAEAHRGSLILDRDAKNTSFVLTLPKRRKVMVA